MHTRSSPSVSILHSLARQANMEERDFRRISKPLLFQRLLATTNLSRLQRAQARALKSSAGGGGGEQAAAAAAAGGRGQEEEYFDCHEEEDGEEDGGGRMAVVAPSSPSGGSAVGRSGLRHRAAASSALPGGGKLSPAEAAAAAAADGGGKSAAAGGQRKGRRPPPPMMVEGKLNDRCPIFGTPLSKHTFRFTRPNGSCVLYDVGSLVDYVLATGSFLEPETRLPLTDADLRHLDALARAAGLQRPSMWEAKHSARQGQIYTDMRFRRDALMGLERCAGELVAEMLTLVETEEQEDDNEEGETWAERVELRLVVTLFPLLADLYRQIEAADREWALQCLAHFAEYMRGPPNRRTRDPHGFLRIILGFFNDLKAGGAHF